MDDSELDGDCRCNLVGPASADRQQRENADLKNEADCAHAHEHSDPLHDALATIDASTAPACARPGSGSA